MKGDIFHVDKNEKKQLLKAQVTRLEFSELQ